MIKIKKLNNLTEKTINSYNNKYKKTQCKSLREKSIHGKHFSKLLLFY